VAVTWRKPRGFPPVRFVWEIVLGVRAPIAAIPRPAKGLIEALPLELYRTGGEDNVRPQFCKTSRHRVVNSQGCLPYDEINRFGREYLPVAEGHLGQDDHICGTHLEKAHQVDPCGFFPWSLIGKLAHCNFHPLFL
jgi:hypothetical protein